jgi:hypothetical protein
MSASSNLNAFQAPLMQGAEPLAQYGIYARDTSQLHDIGRRFLTNEGSVYKYARVKGTLDPDMGAKCYATQNLASAAIVLAQAAGDVQVKCTFGAADGYANSGLVV